MLAQLLRRVLLQLIYRNHKSQILGIQRPQKRSRGNQLIHRRLFKTKSIGRESRSG